jgi:hypothetical protein
MPALGENIKPCLSSKLLSAQDRAVSRANRRGVDMWNEGKWSMVVLPGVGLAILIPDAALW